LVPVTSQHALILVAIGCLCACREAPTRTQVVLQVERDATLPMRGADLSLEVEDRAGTRILGMSEGHDALLATAILTPNSLETLPSYSVTAQWRAEGMTLASARVRGDFVAHEVRYVKLLLSSDCMDDQIEYSARDLSRDGTHPTLLQCVGAPAMKANGTDSPEMTAGRQGGRAPVTGIAGAMTPIERADAGPCDPKDCDGGPPEEPSGCPSALQHPDATCSSWRDRIVIDVAGTRVSDLQLVVNRMGKAFIAFIQPGASEGDDVWAVQLTAEGFRAFQLDPLSSEMTPARASGLVVRLDNAGNATAVWAYALGTGIEGVMTARFSASDRHWDYASVLEPERSLDAGTFVMRVGPSLAVNARGDRMVVWGTRDATDKLIYQARRAAQAGEWSSTSTLLNLRSSFASALQLALDAENTGTLVWQESPYRDAGTAETGQVRSSRAPAAGAADTPVALDDGDLVETTIASESQLRLNAAGGGFVLWKRSLQDTNGSPRQYDLCVRQLTRGGQWQASHVLYSAASDIIDPHSAIDDQGRAAVVWTLQETVDDPHGARRDTNVFASSFDGNHWTAARSIDVPGLGDSFAPEVRADPQTGFIAIWARSDGLSVRIWTSHLNAAGAWSAPYMLDDNPLGPVPIVETAARSAEPHIALDELGQGLAIWRIQQNDELRLAAKRLE
jgi:hypothetical protein